MFSVTYSSKIMFYEHFELQQVSDVFY